MYTHGAESPAGAAKGYPAAHVLGAFWHPSRVPWGVHWGALGSFGVRWGVRWEPLGGPLGCFGVARWGVRWENTKSIESFGVHWDPLWVPCGALWVTVGSLLASFGWFR